MPTSDRTTVKAAISALVTQLRSALVASPVTVSKPFRHVEVGDAGVEEFARPFLTLLLARARTVGVTDNDKVLEVAMRFRIVTDVSGADPNPALLDKIGAIEDDLDGLIDTGVIEGAEGFDDRTWTFAYPKTTSGARVATAEATQTFVVKVERGRNREPAP